MLIEKFTRILFKSSKFNEQYQIYDKILMQVKNIIANQKISLEDKKSALSELRKSFYNPDLAKDIDIKNLKDMFISNQLDGSLFTDVLLAYEKYLDTDKLQVWEEFVNYHRLIASPISRFVLAINDETPSAYLPMETFYSALAMLSCILNIKEQFSCYKRCVIPQSIMDEYGVKNTDLSLSYTSNNVSNMINELIERINAIQMDVKVLPSLIKSFRLRVKLNIIISLTNSMIKKHNRVNVLQNPPAISVMDKIKAFIYGIIRSCIRIRSVKGNIL